MNRTAGRERLTAERSNSRECVKCRSDVTQTIDIDAVNMLSSRSQFHPISGQSHRGAQQAEILARHRRKRDQAKRERAMNEIACCVTHLRICTLGLLVVQAVRASAWLVGLMPGFSSRAVQLIACVSDGACAVLTVSPAAWGTDSACVTSGTLGVSLTLLFSFWLINITAFIGWVVTIMFTPGGMSLYLVHSPDSSWLGIGGPWEFMLVSSAALQVAALTATWRVYRELRRMGIYGRDVRAIDEGESGPSVTRQDSGRDISPLELILDAEDVELLASCETTCRSSAHFEMGEDVSGIAEIDHSFGDSRIEIRSDSHCDRKADGADLERVPRLKIRGDLFPAAPVRSSRGDDQRWSDESSADVFLSAQVAVAMASMSTMEARRAAGNADEAKHSPEAVCIALHSSDDGKCNPHDPSARA
eukprot:TRINITY_DN12412_c0_g1_i1.p1 TRINITY_DN12412_c0_g1~~TRINITY_DN12412_c0_g1_i1.p1  ORF type:complete len:418 (+),score=39.57 TRINITY_DN12412_c0_g1_i1:128-1381(+)